MPTKGLYHAGFAVATTLGLLLVFQIGQKLMGHTVKADVEKGNTAQAILQVGHILGVCLIAASIVAGCVAGESWTTDAIWVGAFGVASVLVLAVTGALGTRLLLRAKLPAEIARGNVAAGLAGAAHYLATSILIARNITGTDLNALGISLVFFVLAQLSMHLFVILFRALTTYDDSEEILGENMAASLSYAGLTVAVGIIVGNASEGNFAGWGPSLKGYGLALLLTLVLYPVRQFVVQTLLLGAMPSPRAGRLDELVGRERNLGASALEAVAYLSTALLIARLA